MASLSPLITFTNRRDALFRRGLLLLSLSEHEDRFKQDAEHVLALVEQLSGQTNHTNDTITKATQVVDEVLQELNKKYMNGVENDKTHEIAAQTWKLCDEVSQSQEANEIIERSRHIAEKWKTYGKSEAGKKLINTFGEMIQNKTQKNSDTMFNMYDKMTRDANGNIKTIDFDKAKIKLYGLSAKKVLEQDEDIQELIKKSRALFDRSDNKEKVDKKLDESAEYVNKLRESGLAKKLLDKGNKLLAQNGGKLDPDMLVAKGTALYNDAEERQKFVTEVKDSAVEFLLSFLPSVHVPSISGASDNIQYTLDNISLAGFKVPADDVFVSIEGKTITVRAINMLCKMDNIAWTVQQNGFPWFSSSGVVMALATQATFECVLTLGTVHIDSKSQPEINSSSNNEIIETESDLNSNSTVLTTKAHETTMPEALPAVCKSNDSQSLSANGTANDYDNVHLQKPSEHARLMNTISTPILDSNEKIHIALRSMKIELPHFDIFLSGGLFASMMNYAASLFKKKIQAYVEHSVNYQVNKNADWLLDTVNSKANQFLPIMTRIQLKAGDLLEKTNVEFQRTEQADNIDTI